MENGRRGSGGKGGRSVSRRVLDVEHTGILDLRVLRMGESLLGRECRLGG